MRPSAVAGAVVRIPLRSFAPEASRRASERAVAADPNDAAVTDGSSSVRSAGTVVTAGSGAT